MSKSFWHHRTARMIAPRLVDIAWNSTELGEVLARFEHVADVETLITRLLERRNHAPDSTEVAAELLEVIGYPGDPFVLPAPPVRPTPAVRFGVPAFATTAELAASLDVTVSELDWFADVGGWLRRAAPPLRHYRAREVAKSRGGTRILEIPKPRLREMQRRVLHRVLDHVVPHPAAHGFRAGRSAVTFARPHEGRDVVVRVDLADFFPTVTRPRVRAVFEACGYPYRVASVLAGVCTTAMPVDEVAGLARTQAALLRVPHLPQGAPTSPALANLVARGLDRRVAGLARARGLVYTRYADDLALSGPSDTDVVTILWALDRIVRDEGFVVNGDKTHVARAHRRQTLAGLVVNESAAAPRDRYDALRALLHNSVRTGAAAQNRAGVPDFRASVYGQIAWIGESSPSRRSRLLAMAERVDWDS
ncbi:reverse transcriptase family protein [Rhodococcus sp. NBC_00297]|uniref:reverse transcriptase family protein n=1 Tax=Rhodococcus sp. NBC_00297 TaxID=2976005 RepID=UPI002E29D497|nr:reverse transcriptase family protein [Rhodococcus sp. NBC_00297]